ncbi:Hypothetical predicted protein [Paramuricea clavata]|uniref:Uncharacterized protein n=1 Tax=Paramuricea clavata TaxID=317549 RepID=A0A7D9J7Y6_PARCT|nr:Hypothetical predicted protein [Paramuricea clavata]
MALETILISVGIKILSSAVGLLVGKVYDYLTKKPDLSNEELRQIIVRDLNDIKSKLDCISLKDLGASYSFLREGVRVLNLALDKWNEDQKASEGPTDEATKVINDTASGILNAALSLPQAIQRLKISSDKRFVSAQDRFKESRKAATYAFHDKSLSIKDRIMACKLRVAASILESGLEDPEVAITACLLSLEELHGLPEIQEMFAVFLKGGLKTEHLENIMSVLFINHVLYDFASKYSSKSTNPFTWPGIELKDRTFYPILNTHEILTKTSSSKEFVQQLKRVVVDWMAYDKCFAVNSRGEIILLDADKITVIYSAGESKDFMLPVPTESNVDRCHGSRDIAVDSNDNVYVVRTEKNGNNKRDFVLYALDENYNLKHVSVLVVLHPPKALAEVNIAVDKHQNVIMRTNKSIYVYIYENTGKLKSEIFSGSYNHWPWVSSLCISNNNDIMIESDDFSAVLIYSTKRKLKFTIKVPEGHNVARMAFHHGICKIIVLTHVEKQDSWFLLGYSETGELENSVFFSKRDSNRYWRDIYIKSHPCGPIAVGVRGEIILL